MKHNPANQNGLTETGLSCPEVMGLCCYIRCYIYSVTVLHQRICRNSDSTDLTPGHPEYGHTVGVEATTGPLGAEYGYGCWHGYSRNILLRNLIKTAILLWTIIPLFLAETAV